MPTASASMIDLISDPSKLMLTEKLIGIIREIRMTWAAVPEDERKLIENDLAELSATLGSKVVGQLVMGKEIDEIIAYVIDYLGKRSTYLKSVLIRLAKEGII